MQSIAWNWVDLVLLAATALSVVVGLWRGLLFEVLSLVGWLAAYLGAQWWSGDVAAELPWIVPDSAQGIAVAFALTFIGLLVAWTLAARMLRAVVHATPLKLIDRLFGGLFGVLRAGVLLLVLATLALLSPIERMPAWRASTGAQWLTAAVALLKPMLPESMARHLPARAG